MSDYEVTLVNDNSTCLLLNIAARCLVLLSRHTPVPEQTGSTNVLRQCPSAEEPTLHILRTALILLRQEFFVRFKGPEESRLSDVYCLPSVY